MRFKYLIQFAGILLLIAVARPITSPAQSATTGALSGTVTDMESGALPGVSITLVNTGTRQTLTTATDASGAYGFSLLPPGTYQVDFATPGFKTSREEMV